MNFLLKKKIHITNTTTFLLFLFIWICFIRMKKRFFFSLVLICLLLLGLYSYFLYQHYASHRIREGKNELVAQTTLLSWSIFDSKLEQRLDKEYHNYFFLPSKAKSFLLQIPEGIDFHEGYPIVLWIFKHALTQHKLYFSPNLDHLQGRENLSPFEYRFDSQELKFYDKEKNCQIFGIDFCSPQQGWRFWWIKEKEKQNVHFILQY